MKKAGLILRWLVTSFVVGSALALVTLSLLILLRQVLIVFS